MSFCSSYALNMIYMAKVSVLDTTAYGNIVGPQRKKNVNTNVRQCIAD